MQIIDDRRQLYTVAEQEKDLPKTLDYIRLKLAFLPCQVFSPRESAICAWFDFGANSAIAFQADMDGRTHACGHMAMLLELARRLGGRKDIKKNILLVFQPTEESAKEICDSGVFKKYKVEAIFGLQLWPGLEKGVIASREKEMFSRNCEVTVEITGRPAHVGSAEEGLDALAAAVSFYNRATEMEQALPWQEYRLLKFGTLRGGAARNAIADRAKLEGTLRTFRDDVFHHLRAGLVTLAKDLEDSTGCQVSVDMNDGYPAVVNPPELFRKVSAFAPVTELENPLMISEGFSWYQRFLPGMFCLLGVGDPRAADFDESVLLKGVEFYETLIREYR